MRFLLQIISSVILITFVGNSLISCTASGMSPQPPTPVPPTDPVVKDRAYYVKLKAKYSDMVIREQNEMIDFESDSSIKEICGTTDKCADWSEMDNDLWVEQATNYFNKFEATWKIAWFDNQQSEDFPSWVKPELLEALTPVEKPLQDQLAWISVNVGPRRYSEQELKTSKARVDLIAKQKALLS